MVSPSKRGSRNAICRNPLARRGRYGKRAVNDVCESRGQMGSQPPAPPLPCESVQGWAHCPPFQAGPEAVGLRKVRAWWRAILKWRCEAAGMNRKNQLQDPTEAAMSAIE